MFSVVGIIPHVLTSFRKVVSEFLEDSASPAVSVSGDVPILRNPHDAHES